jgi:hypothetical protein
MVDGDVGKPGEQFRASWQAMKDAMNEWSRRISEATHEALDKIEPAVRAAAEAGRSAMTGEWRDCQCRCTAAHPADTGVCDGRAVMVRRVSGSDVSLCAPCAVAQGVAEMKL